MAKKHIKRASHHHKVVKRGRVLRRSDGDYLVMVRGWMLVVAFALMLGIGAIVGNFINAQLNASTPTVAGAEISK